MDVRADELTGDFPPREHGEGGERVLRVLWLEIEHQRLQTTPAMVKEMENLEKSRRGRGEERIGWADLGSGRVGPEEHHEVLQVPEAQRVARRHQGLGRALRPSQGHRRDVHRRGRGCHRRRRGGRHWGGKADGGVRACVGRVATSSTDDGYGEEDSSRAVVGCSSDGCPMTVCDCRILPSIKKKKLRKMSSYRYILKID